MSIAEEKRRVAYINEMIESGHAAQLVAEGEKYHADQLSSIAQTICANPNVRVVLISGPSSSGKTSTSHRLCLELLAQGKQPVALSLDNWYVDGSLTPLDENGKKDYESVYAIDLNQFEIDLKALIAGEKAISSTEVMHRYQISSTTSISRSKIAFIKNDILDNKAGDISFQDPIYAYWLKTEYFAK